jgi:hypothetical protein
MRETIEEYTWCSAYFEYRQSKNLTVCSPGNSLLCGVPNTAGATLCIRIPQEEPHFVAPPAGATSPLLLRSHTTTPEQIALREILLQEEIQG